jgi:hypothetical protein
VSSQPPATTVSTVTGPAPSWLFTASAIVPPR